MKILKIEIIIKHCIKSCLYFKPEKDHRALESCKDRLHSPLILQQGNSTLGKKIGVKTH